MNPVELAQKSLKRIQDTIDSVEWKEMPIEIPEGKSFSGTTKDGTMMLVIKCKLGEREFYQGTATFPEGLIVNMPSEIALKAFQKALGQ